MPNLQLPLPVAQAPLSFGTLTGMLFVTGRRERGSTYKTLSPLFLFPRLLPCLFSNVPLCLFFLISAVERSLICMREMWLSFKCYVNLPRLRQNTHVGFKPPARSNTQAHKRPKTYYYNDTPLLLLMLPPFIFISKATACWFKWEVRQKLRRPTFTHCILDRTAGVRVCFSELFGKYWS